MQKLGIWAACCVLVVAGSAALAGEHNGHNGSNKHSSHHKSKKNGYHHDNGRHLAKGHHKFDNSDREIARSWCHEHHDRLPVGFRPTDRLAPQLEARLQVGVVIQADMRGFIHPVPTDLIRRLPPPPVDVRYVAIGGHIGLIDHAHRLMDMLPLP